MANDDGRNGFDLNEYKLHKLADAVTDNISFLQDQVVQRVQGGMSAGDAEITVVVISQLGVFP